MLKAWRDNRELIKSFVARDIALRYKNSALGLSWLIGQPLIQLALYSFVFGVILRTRFGIPLESGGEVPFGFVLFSGILLHATLSEALVRGPSLITSYPAYVKRVVFPLEILPLSNALSAALFCFVGLAVLLVAFLAFGGTPRVTWWLTPLPVLMVFLFTLAAAQLLGALGVYFRDLGQLTSHLSTILLFTAPICYPLEMIPESMRWLLQLNPLTVPVNLLHDILFRGAISNGTGILLHLVVSASLLVFTSWCFGRMREGFADAV